MEEIWKDIPGFEGVYQVSNKGNVKRLYNSYHKAQEHILKPGLSGGNKDGERYLYVNLCYQNKKKPYYIHRLVAECFLPNQNNKPQVDHINQNKMNNHLSNLRWVSRSENHLNKTHKLSSSGYRYIRFINNRYNFRISRRKDGKVKDIVSQTFPTLAEAIQARDEYLQLKENVRAL
jgi:hypothetical protein